MKQRNVDFLIAECTRILKESLEYGSTNEEVLENFNEGIRNEYKYLLRGPKK